jgi:hypothetical protein
MEEGPALIGARAHFWEIMFSKKGQWHGDTIIPYFCTECGYIEMYKEP